jgi:hypothetical protein
VDAAGRAVAAVLDVGARAERLAAGAHRRVCDSYLASHHFSAEAALFERMLG